jgi:peptidyl-prolyl cis-trans isomerase B (cyclophilin B)
LRRAFATCLLVLALVLAGCGGDKGANTRPSAAPPQQSLPGASGQGAGAAGCKQVPAPSPKPEGHENKPQGVLDASKRWKLVVRTNCGAFTIALDLDKAPNTAASLVSLTRSGFFDGTTFHRIVPGFVIQGGDPTGSGEGGPGYSTVDKPPGDARYTRGVVAMAKTETEDPGTAGSQFFVVTGQDAGLPPDYAVAGKVVDGLGVVEKIGKLGDAGTEKPRQPIVIEKVTVKPS